MEWLYGGGRGREELCAGGGGVGRRGGLRSASVSYAGRAVCGGEVEAANGVSDYVIDAVMDAVTDAVTNASNVQNCLFSHLKYCKS